MFFNINITGKMPMRLFSFYANLTPNSKPGIWMAGMLENIKTVQYNDDLINH